MNFDSLARIVLVVGAAILLLGGILFLIARLGFTHLPGDLVFRGGKVTVYIPLGLSILASIILTILLNVLGRR